MRKELVVAALVLASPLATAQDVQPGLWQISMETRVPAQPDFTPPATTLTQCISAQDAKQPGMLFSQMANPGAHDCRYQDRNYHGGNSFTFAMTCEGTFQLRSKGQVNFTRTSMDGTVSAVATINDKDVETQSKLAARRMGDC